MVVNADKTKCMLLGTMQKLQLATANLCVHGNKSMVKPVQVRKVLGLYMEGNLTWNAHVTKLSAKLCSFVFVFLQMGETANATTSMETIFYRNVQPLIDYGCVISENCGHNWLMNVRKVM